MKISCRLLVLFVACSILSGVFPVIGFGDVRVEPRLTLREEYDSNIFLDSEGNPDGDMISTVKPGIKLALDTNLLLLDLDYSLDFRFYKDNPDEDQTSLRDAQRILGEGTILPGRDFSIDLLDEYSSVVIDEQLPVSENNPTVNKSILNHFEIYPNYRLRHFKTWEFRLGYRYRDMNYDVDTANSSKTNIYDFSVFKEISEKFRLLGRYVYQDYTGDNTEDYTRNDYVAGFEYQLTSNLGVGIEGGEIRLDFDERGKKSGPFWNAWCSYQLTPTISSKLVYTRDFYDSVEEGSTNIEQVALNISQVGQLVTNDLGLFASRQEYLTTDREDRSAGMTLNVNIPLSERFVAGLNGYLTYFRFDDGVLLIEDVTRWAAGCSLGYRFRIGTLSTGYVHEESDSEVDINDYDSDRVYVQLAMTF